MAFTQPIPGVPWYDVADPASPELDELSKRFGLHELEIEDCRQRPQRAKYSEHDPYLFCIFKRLQDRDEVLFDDVDVFLGRDFLITVHEHADDLIKRISRRAQESSEHRLDRIFYFIADELTDAYLPTLDVIAEATDEIEDQVLDRPSPAMLQRIFDLKRKLVGFRRNANGMREVMNAIVRKEGGCTGDDLDPYFRDVYDHLVRTVDLIESYRDLLSSSLDIYLSAVANRTNDVMKVLAVYGTVATPLVIITGFFGMNIPMPFNEQPHALGYAIALMLVTSAIALWYFKRKGWF
ncbi:MAG: magnesium/cobalt transporter CorA [Acidobacteriales bacterium]|nr:magnesium/cobalt transporter CorA [Terriglobales bacterium]